MRMGLIQATIYFQDFAAGMQETIAKGLGLPNPDFKFPVVIGRESFADASLFYDRKGRPVIYLNDSREHREDFKDSQIAYMEFLSGHEVGHAFYNFFNPLIEKVWRKWTKKRIKIKNKPDPDWYSNIDRFMENVADFSALYSIDKLGKLNDLLDRLTLQDRSYTVRSPAFRLFMSHRRNSGFEDLTRILLTGRPTNIFDQQ